MLQLLSPELSISHLFDIIFITATSSKQGAKPRAMLKFWEPSYQDENYSNKEHDYSKHSKNTKISEKPHDFVKMKLNSIAICKRAKNQAVKILHATPFFTTLSVSKRFNLLQWLHALPTLRLTSTRPHSSTCG